MKCKTIEVCTPVCGEDRVAHCALCALAMEREENAKLRKHIKNLTEIIQTHLSETQAELNRRFSRD